MVFTVFLRSFLIFIGVHRRSSAVNALLLGVLALTAGAALAQADEGIFRFDVPYVPTPQPVVDEMLRVANVGPQDFIIDLGSGDGRIPITAAGKFGARGFGVDLDPDRIAESRYNLEQSGLGERVAFHQRDLFETDLAQATVISMYLLPAVNLRLRPKLLELKPGTRIVSHDFDLGEWKPDRKVLLRKNIFLWIVPAKVAGKWRIPVELPSGKRDYELELRQQFQEFDGVVRFGPRPVGLWKPKLEGEHIRFVIVDSLGPTETSLYFEGRVAGDIMEGTLTRGVGREATRQAWRATRTGR
jgi:SAM-dependent methyltransferase